VTAPLEEAWTLPSSWYVDGEHHAREMRHVVSRAWHYVAPLDLLASAGAYVVVDVDGEPIVVVRGGDDTVRAFYNVCRHRAGQVVRGDGSAPGVDGAGCAAKGMLRCLYHGWTYGLDGALCGAPEMQEARDFDMKAFGLRSVRCETAGRCVFVNLADDAPALASSLGADAALLDAVRAPFFKRQSWDILCNWKVYVDNFLEGYHVPRAHPTLHQLLDYKDYVVEPHGQTIVQHAPPRDPTKGAPPSTYLWLHPLFMLNITPQYTQTNAIVPLSVDETRVVFDFFFDPSVSEQERAANLALSDDIQREDIELCEAVQRNLGSRSYTAGRYCPRRENGLFHFHELLRSASS